MKNQYLIVAENIIYKNNKLTCINIYDKFTGITIPAEFIFDLAIICGPNWEPGTYKLTVEVEINNVKSSLGSIDVKIPHKRFTYNAIANNIKLSINNEVEQIRFRIYQEQEVLIERDYPIATVFNLVEKKQPQEPSTVVSTPVLKIVEDNNEQE